MATLDPRIDAYIEKAAPFAQPILIHLRMLMHRACPELVEAIKWHMPFFTLHDKNLAHMAAFKAHAVFGFWEGLKIETPLADEAMGHFGRLRSCEDLPEDEKLLSLIAEAMARLEEQQQLRSTRTTTG